MDTTTTAKRSASPLAGFADLFMMAKWLYVRAFYGKSSARKLSIERRMAEAEADKLRHQLYTLPAEIARSKQQALDTMNQQITVAREFYASEIRRLEHTEEMLSLHLSHELREIELRLARGENHG